MKLVVTTVLCVFLVSAYPAELESRMESDAEKFQELRRYKDQVLSKRLYLLVQMVGHEGTTLCTGIAINHNDFITAKDCFTEESYGKYMIGSAVYHDIYYDQDPVKPFRKNDHGVAFVHFVRRLCQREYKEEDMISYSSTTRKLKFADIVLAARWDTNMEPMLREVRVLQNAGAYISVLSPDDSDLNFKGDPLFDANGIVGTLITYNKGGRSTYAALCDT